jgi:hypothetical protein
VLACEVRVDERAELRARRVDHERPGLEVTERALELLLHLRCVLLDDAWESFESHLAEQWITLAAKPAPARTHDARPSPLAAAA